METLKLKDEITCSCGHTFKIADAEFCEGHYVSPCNCRGVGDCDWNGCSKEVVKTLICPSCGDCACHKVKRWRRERKVKKITHDKFDFVHKSLIQEDK